MCSPQCLACRQWPWFLGNRIYPLAPALVSLGERGEHLVAWWQSSPSDQILTSIGCGAPARDFLSEEFSWGEEVAGEEGSSLGPGLPGRSLPPKTSHHFLPNPSAESENPAGLTSPPQVCASLFLSLPGQSHCLKMPSGLTTCC